MKVVCRWWSREWLQLFVQWKGFHSREDIVYQSPFSPASILLKILFLKYTFHCLVGVVVLLLCNVSEWVLKWKRSLSGWRCCLTEAETGDEQETAESISKEERQGKQPEVQPRVPFVCCKLQFPERANERQQVIRKRSIYLSPQIIWKPNWMEPLKRLHFSVSPLRSF